MRVLVACEFSGIVREAFKARGHDAWSCDLLPTEIPGNHIQDDVLKHLNDGWDLMIAHPPCTWLCQSMLVNSRRKDRPKITEQFESKRKEAFDFVMLLAAAPIPKIAIENPHGYLNQAWRSADGMVYPWEHGHSYSKPSCFWLKGLRPLQPSVALFNPPPYKKLDFWSDKRNPNNKSLKSITFSGIAKAMAEQWG